MSEISTKKTYEVIHDDLDAQLNDFIANNRGNNVSYIARQLQRPESTIRYRVKTLERDGLISTKRSRRELKCYPAGEAGSDE